MNRDAERPADSPIGQSHVFTVTVSEFKRQLGFAPGRLLKTSCFSPTQPGRLFHPPTPKLPRQPLCPGTRLFPCVVLASFRSSRLKRRPSEVGSAGGTFPFAKIHCTGEWSKRSAIGTSSGLHWLRPCGTNFLSTCGVSLPCPKHIGIGILPCHERFCEAPWIGYTSYHAIWLLAMDIVPRPHDAVCPRDAFRYAGPGSQVGLAFMSWSRVDVRPLPGPERNGL